MNQIIEIGVHGMVAESQALPDLRSVPNLAVVRRQHAEKTLDCLRFCGEPPLWKVSLGQDGEIIRLPDRKAP